MIKSENHMLVLAIAAVIVSAIGAGISYNSFSVGEKWFTGYVTDTGTVNLTVITTASINFTTDNINFGVGRVDAGAPNATLVTTGRNNTGGNWTNVTQGFVLENIGNLNVTISLSTGKNAATFLGGTNPRYQFNVTNVEIGSCINRSGYNLGQWYDANTTSPGTYICSNFSFSDVRDTIRIDVRLVVPSDSLTGDLGDIVTADAQLST